MVYQLIEETKWISNKVSPTKNKLKLKLASN